MENLNGHVPFLRSIAQILSPCTWRRRLVRRLSIARRRASTMAGRRHQVPRDRVPDVDDWEGVRIDLSSYFAEKVRSAVHAKCRTAPTPAGIVILLARS